MRPLLSFIANTDQDAEDHLVLIKLAENKARIGNLSPDERSTRQQILSDIASRQKHRAREIKQVMKN